MPPRRTTTRRAVLALLLTALPPMLLPSGPLSPLGHAHAQQRPIPPTARAGTLNIGVFPAAVLDGKAITMGAGARIYDRENRIVLPASIQGKALRIAYAVGPNGELVQAWILTDADYRALRARR